MSRPEEYMQRALELGRQNYGRTRPNPAVGAVVVRDGVIVGEGSHRKAGEAHAEIIALRQAGEKAGGADLYVTLEPCSHQGRTGPCADAVLAAGIGRVVIGTLDPNPQVAGKGIARLRMGGVEVRVGLLESECRRLIAPFAKHVTTGRPYVTLKAAMTLDGKTATATGDSRWISNTESRDLVHRLRDRSDAIMVGIGTVLRDDSRLTTRLESGGRDATRVVVDSSLRIPENAAIFHSGSKAPTLIATTRRADGNKIERLRRQGAEILSVAEKEGQIDLYDLMFQLGARGLQNLILEGGGVLNSSALASGIVDRIMVFIAPKLLCGADGKGIFAGTGFARLADAVQLTDVRVSRFGDDTLIEGEIERCLRG